jgi:hypothetical protein
LKGEKMKRIKSITLAVVCAIVLLVSVTLVANAQSDRTFLTATEYDCLTDPGAEPWMRGDVLHMRNVLHVNFDVSDTPEFNGINTTVADAEINFKTGGAVIRGKLNFQPDGIAGTWEGSWVFIGKKGKGTAQAVAHGTGALSGKTLFLTLYDAAPDDPRYVNLPAICAGVGEPEGIVLVEGYILNSGKP